MVSQAGCHTGVHDHRALVDAPFSPVHRAFAGFLAPARSLGDASVHGQIAEQQADETVVISFEHHTSKGVHYPLFDPLVSPTAQRGSRTPLLGDPPVSAAEHQDLYELLEDHPVGDTGTMAAERMVHVPLGQQGDELLEDGLDDVWLECGGTDLLLRFGKLRELPG
jgi:hypothetical protein